ncbi:MAG: tetratricopeptide repeat-containing sulfotransferase family protein, partial [Gammaproteobacteria bacterium]
VQLAPGHAFAWQLLSVLAHEAGQTAQAVELMGKAIQALPLVGSFYANRGEMHRLLGDLPKAIADGEQAVKLEPRSAAAYGNLGVALYQAGKIDEAEAAQKQALRYDANHLQALNNLGSILRDRKDREGAAAMYRKALAINPAYTEARNNLGAVLIELEDPEGALRELVQVVRQAPRYAEAHCNIGNAFCALDDFSKAEAAYKNAIALKPEYPEATEGLARCAQETRDLPQAETLVRQAIALKPGRSSAWTLLGSIHSEQAFPDKAAEAYRHALELDPANGGALIGLGHVEMEQGRMEAAEGHFRQAIALSPDNIAPRLSLTQVRKTREGDADFAALEAAAKDIDKMPESRALALHFALGKGYEDLKRHDEAFPHFIEGCRLKRKRVEYSADNTDLIGDNICKTFTREFVDSLRGGGDPADTPIFVLGMPRSGTTLTETIIASHPDVYGAGELPDLLHIASLGPKGDDAGYPLNLDGVTREQLTAMGRQYVDQIRQRAPSARRITDKMPANFNAVGLIHLMLPNAKIVHIKRNAVDT